MGLVLTPNQINAIRKIAQKKSIYSFELNVKSATVEGDGYSGSLSIITLQSAEKELQLILKEAAPTENSALKIFRRKSYLREIYVYNNVLQEFETFQKENNVLNGFTGFARIYGSCDMENSEYLILENLKKTGYKMWNRKVPMNAEHVALVFSEYGKFHALSLAMKEKRPNKYQALAKHLGDFYSSSLPREDASLTIRNILKVGFLAVEHDEVASKSFKRFTSIVETFLLDDTEIEEDKLVVTHCDCWCNNMLFKYEDIEDLHKPSKVCFVDWQLSKIGSPVLDLSYFFFVCIAGDMLSDYEKYLKIYHSTVCEVLTKFSCDPEKLFPYTLLEYHWKKYAKFGLYAILMTINLMLLDTDAICNGNEQPRSEEFDSKNVKFEENRTNDRFKRIVDVINVMAQHDLI